jgi:hypothetical protein
VQFLKLHWEVLAATDFFTVEVATWHGVVTYYVPVVMELATRRVHIAGIMPHPIAAFMQQCARQVTDPFDGCLLNAISSTIGTPNSPKCSMACLRAAGWNLSSYRRGVRISMPTASGLCVRSGRKCFIR